MIIAHVGVDLPGLPSLLLVIVHVLKILFFLLQIIKLVFGHNFLNLALLMLNVLLNMLVQFKDLLLVVVDVRLVGGPLLRKLDAIGLLLVPLAGEHLELGVLSGSLLTLHFLHELLLSKRVVDALVHFFFFLLELDQTGLKLYLLVHLHF